MVRISYGICEYHKNRTPHKRFYAVFEFNITPASSGLTFNHFFFFLKIFLWPRNRVASDQQQKSSVAGDDTYTHIYGYGSPRVQHYILMGVMFSRAAKTSPCVQCVNSEVVRYSISVTQSIIIRFNMLECTLIFVSMNERRICPAI